MAVTTKKLFPATSNATTTVFSPVGIQLNNQDDLDVYVTLSGGTRVLQLRQSTGSTADSNHPQVNNTDGLYFPAVTAGTTLYNYQLSTDNNTITFNSALPQGAVVFCERRTRDADSSYTSFASGSTIRATDLNNSSTESNFTAQDGRNKALTIEGVLFRGDQPSTNFVTTDHIVAGTIVENDISNSSVTQNKLADNSVGTNEIINGSVTREKIVNDAIDQTKIDANAINSTHYQDGSINRVHLEADIIDGTKLEDNAVNSEHYVDGSIDNEHLAPDAVNGNKIADDSINSEHIVAGALDNEHYAAGSITSDKLNGATVVTNSEQAASTPNDTSFFTTAAAEARYFNVSSGETIKDGDTFPDNDTTIATTAAINDRIIDLVDDVGGFVPIANETSFPTANPDVNNGTGTLVSIKSISSTRTPSSGTVTIANGAGTGNTVLITGCGSTVLSAGFGVIVETTSTLHTYAFHRLVPKATEVTTVAGKATEIGLLGTAAAVEDMSILGTTDVVADMAILGTTDVVADLNTLGTADVVADMNTLAVTSVVNNMDTVAGAVTNVNNVGNSIANVNTTAGSIANVNTVAGSIANVNTTAGSISNVNTTAGSISNVNTVASNISSVNSFANVYRIGANNPNTSLDVGDLFFNTTSNSLKVYTGSAWVDGVTQTGDFALKTGNTFTGSNRYNDNVKAEFGTGADLEIYHTGIGSYIADTGQGNLHILSNQLQIINGANTEIQATFQENGAVSLYYDNVKKFETIAGGAKVTGTLAELVFNATNGTGHEFKFRASGTNATGIELFDTTRNERAWLYHDDTYLGGVHHFHTDGTLRLAVENGNVRLPNDNEKLLIGASDDLQILHTGGQSEINSITGGLQIKDTGGFMRIRSDELKIQSTANENYIEADANGSVQIFYDNVKKFETRNDGVAALGNCRVDSDTGKFLAGLSSDLEMYHNGTHSFIKNNTGTTYLQGPSNLSFIANNKDVIMGIVNAEVSLFYNNVKKFETTSYGVKTSGEIEIDSGHLRGDSTNGLRMFSDSTATHGITLTTSDHLVPSTDSTSDLGLTGTRWRNAYVDTYYGDGSNLTGINTDLVSDTSPQLGGTLDTNNNNIHFNDNVSSRFGTDQDFDVYHSGSHAYLSNGTGNLFIEIPESKKFQVQHGAEAILNGYADGRVELYHDNSKKFETTSEGAKITTTASNVAAKLEIEATNGGQPTLLLKSSKSGTNRASRIDFLNQDSTTPKWTLLNDFNQNGTNDFRLTNTASSSQTALRAVNNGTIQLYHAGNTKLETTSGGVTVTGTVTATSFSGDGSNLTGISAGTSLSGSTDNTICTVTGANAIQGESNLTYNGNHLVVKSGTHDGGIEVLAANNNQTTRVKLQAKSSGGTDHNWFMEVPRGSDILNFFDDTHGSHTQLKNNGDLSIVDGNLELADGHGIDFSATGSPTNGTGDSELLNDYEEGSWTPTVTFGGGTTGQGYNHQVGRYVKIGRLVHIQCYVVFNNKGSSTGTAKLANLPYPTRNQSNMYPSAAIAYFHNGSNSAGPGSTSTFMVYGEVNETNLNIQREEVSDGTPEMNDAQDYNFANNSEFMLTMTYVTN